MNVIWTPNSPQQPLNCRVDNSDSDTSTYITIANILQFSIRLVYDTIFWQDPILPYLFWPTGHGCCSIPPLLFVCTSLSSAQCYTCLFFCAGPDVGSPTPAPDSFHLSYQLLTTTRKWSSMMNLYKFCNKPLSARNIKIPADVHSFGSTQCTCLRIGSFPGECEGCRPETYLKF